MVGRFELSSRVVRSPKGVDQATPDGHLLLDLGSGEYFELGRVGGFIWERLDGSAPLEGLVSAVVERFEVSPEEARDDLVAFVGQLLAAGLARVEG